MKETPSPGMEWLMGTSVTALMGTSFMIPPCNASWTALELRTPSPTAQLAPACATASQGSSGGTTTASSIVMKLFSPPAKI